MAGTSSGIVAGLTAAALGTVGFLAYRAQATVPASLGAGPTAHATAPSKAPRDQHNPAALPSGSGTGERVVYSVDDDRVWLVAPGNRVQRSFPVRPGSVDPPAGTYWVTSRSNAATGTDGVPIEHVVRFTSVDGVAIGFSAALNGGSDTAADPSVKTGGIRESREDGDAMWKFATIGVRVVVIR
ncbi:MULTISPECIES: hypothetical protein [Streptomyces]|uniref:hypothetical protein n=1 Tax=Streptomyces TaxID=1883 RepID=UPI00073DC5FB|nr:hypothetical protein [Streptomyces sp. EAS-AB2608]MYU29477.1 hypothetical protein [Streptomyces sp. SID7810]CUW30531.1 hypothetical protein TUE45_05262 [Streptomyces reticuli]